jgi:hypothetical protein
VALQPGREEGSEQRCGGADLEDEAPVPPLADGPPQKPCWPRGPKWVPQGDIDGKPPTSPGDILVSSCDAWHCMGWLAASAPMLWCAACHMHLLLIPQVTQQWIMLWRHHYPHDRGLTLNPLHWFCTYRRCLTQ